MLLQVPTIARNTLTESLRQPIFLVLVLLCGVLLILSTWATGFSMGYSDETSEVTGDNKLLFDVGLATVFVCGMLLTAFIATSALSREIENKTVLTVVSKPVGRTSLVLGKFAGLAGAITIAVVTMLLFLLLGLRHEVMSTAADDLDGPVIIFSLAALVLSLGVAAWTNFFYGWSFPQIAGILLLPLMAIAYVLVLAIDKKWEWQPLTTDLKPQVMLACAAMLCSMFTLTAVAAAASTRLGQVMTIVVCAGVFVFGLLSNYLVGRHAFEGTPIAVIKQASPDRIDMQPFAHVRDTYHVVLDAETDEPFRPGSSFFYGSTPGGLDTAVPDFPTFTGDVSNSVDLFGPGTPGRIVVTKTGGAGTELDIRNTGRQPLPIARPPRAGDYVFREHPRVSPLPLALWAVVPNMQHFWLLDAVTQNAPIPLAHLGLIVIYTVFQSGAFLCIAVVLFQKRDVG